MELQIVLSCANGKALSDIIMNDTEFGDGTIISAPEPTLPFASGIKRMSRKIAKTVVNVTEYLGAGTVNSMFEKFKSVLSNFINRTIKRNGIKANIQANEIIKDGNSLIIDFSVSEIDYFSISKKAIPLIFDEYLKDSSGVFVQIVNIIGYENEEFIFAVLNAISDEKKEQIIGVLIDNYQETICEKMTDILAKQNIDIEINKVSML